MNDEHRRRERKSGVVDSLLVVELLESPLYFFSTALVSLREDSDKRDDREPVIPGCLGTTGWPENESRENSRCGLSARHWSGAP